jgi:5,10-methylenetetrahydromethanopterin reductase
MRARFGFGTKSEYPPARWAALVRQVEAAGFSSLWVADERLYRNVYTALTLAATHSARLRLGSAVTNPYVRPPAVTAAAIASVDEVSGGRTVLGIGAGGSATAAVGLGRPHPARALREAIGIINGLTAGQRVEMAGEIFSFAGSLDFTPLRRVPVWLAARGPRLLELGGELADGVIVGGFVSEAALRFARARIAAGARRAGRDPAAVPTVAWIYGAAHPDRAVARRAVGFLVALSIMASRPVLAEIGVRLPPALAEYVTAHEWRMHKDVVAGAAAHLSEELVRDFSVAGPPDECVERLRELAASGFEELALLVHPTDGQSIEEALGTWQAIMEKV